MLVLIIISWKTSEFTKHNCSYSNSKSIWRRSVSEMILLHFFLDIPTNYFSKHNYCNTQIQNVTTLCDSSNSIVWNSSITPTICWVWVQGIAYQLRNNLIALHVTTFSIKNVVYEQQFTCFYFLNRHINEKLEMKYIKLVTCGKIFLVFKCDKTTTISELILEKKVGEKCK